MDPREVDSTLVVGLEQLSEDLDTLSLPHSGI